MPHPQVVEPPPEMPHSLLGGSVGTIAPCEDPRAAWSFWSVSELLANHRGSLEAAVSAQVRRASDDAIQRIELLHQEVGRLGDRLSKNLDGLHGEGVGVRAKEGGRLTQQVAQQESAIKTMADRLGKVEAMDAQILCAVRKFVSAGKLAEETGEPPAVHRLQDEVARMHEQICEKHEETLAKLHSHHVECLQELMQQVQAFGGGGGKGGGEGVAGKCSSGKQYAASNLSTGAAPEAPKRVSADDKEDRAAAGYTKEWDEASIIGSDGSNPLNSFRSSFGLSEVASERRRQPIEQGLTIDVETLEEVQGWIKHRDSFDEPVVGLERFRNVLEVFSSCFIVLNILYLGVETEFSMIAAQKGELSPAWLWWVSIIFGIVFSAELAVRLAMEKCRFFSGKNWRWNLFDAVLVLVQVVDIAFAVVNLTFVRCLRCMRSLKALRIIKTVSYVRQLRLMVASIGASLPSLMWSFVLLLLVLYLFALALEQTIQAYIEIAGSAGLHPDLTAYYGSLGSAMVTLFMAISGGADWSDLLAPLEQISAAYVAFFMGFVTFTLFGMLNILTAVFVEATNRIAEVDQDLVIQGHLDHETSVIGKLRDYLMQTDTDGSGTISKAEFQAQLSTPYFQAQLSLMELDRYEADGVFRILNIHDTDEVAIEELIYGLIRLKGNAKAVDVVTMLSESRRIVRRLAAFMRYTEDSFQDLREDLGLCVRPSKDMKSYYMQSSAAAHAALKA